MRRCLFYLHTHLILYGGHDTLCAPVYCLGQLRRGDWDRTTGHVGCRAVLRGHEGRRDKLLLRQVRKRPVKTHCKRRVASEVCEVVIVYDGGIVTKHREALFEVVIQ